MELDDADALRTGIKSFLRVQASAQTPEVTTLKTWEEDGYVRYLLHLGTEDDVIPAFSPCRRESARFPVS